MVRGILFDKDGTLFHFRSSYAEFTRDLLLDLAGGDRSCATAMSHALGFDLATSRFAADSVVIAGTPAEMAQAILPDLDGWSADEVIARMNASFAALPLVEAVPLVPLLAGLIARGLRLGVVTNDAYAPARAHLTSVGVQGAFEFVAGYDSGHGAKPAPGQLHAFAHQTGLAPDQIVMVGDSRHDLQAGRAAGMRTAGVLTGLAPAGDLADLADVVLPDIGALPGWIDTLG